MGVWRTGVGAWRGARVVEKLCRAKSSAFRSLRQRPGNSSEKGCSIM
jgi:hypothetical protein